MSTYSGFPRYVDAYDSLIRNIAFAHTCDFRNLTDDSELEAVFLIGAPRSGLTVVSQCLAQHSMIAGADESAFLVNLWHVYSCLFKGQNRRKWKPLEGFVDDTTMLKTIQQFAETILSSLTSRAGKCIALDHTPWYAAIVPFIAALFPRARFVHVIRDGRAVVASLERSYRNGRAWCGNTTEARAKLWRTLVQAGLDGGAQLGAANYFELRYEKLCSDPNGEISSLLTRLNLPFEPSVLQPLALAHANPSREDALIATRDADKLSFRRLDPVGWPQEWQPESKTSFLKVASELMQRLGYLEAGLAQDAQ